MSKNVTLQQVAEELNKVMAYGLDDEGNIENKEELIDVEMSDAALEAEILKRCVEDGDLRDSDRPDFSKDVWQWFIDFGIMAGKKSEIKAEKSNSKEKERNRATEDKRPDRERGRERDLKPEKKQPEERRDRERDRDLELIDRSRDRERERAEKPVEREDRERNRDRDDRGKERSRMRDDTKKVDREPRTKPIKSESYVNAAYRIAEGCIKDKVQKKDYVYEMLNGLKPLFEEAGNTKGKYMLERACHYTVEMYGMLNVGNKRTLMEDNADLIEDKDKKE